MSEKTLVTVFCVVAIVAALAVVIPGAIWLLTKYIEFLGWAGGL